MITTSPFPKIVCVIVNWERPADTIECIDSVLRSNVSEMQVLVVDNGSRDDSREKISRRFPQITLVSLPQNLGFAGGYNEGIKHALRTGASHIFILNNDTVIEPETISRLMDSPWDVVVPKIVFHDKPDYIWSAGARWRAFPPGVVMIGFRKKDGPLYASAYPLEYATACALMIQRHVFEIVGGFDLEFVNYMEDYDFTYRVKENKFSMGFIPDAKVFHKVSQTLGEYSPKRWKYQGKNTVLFYRKDSRFSWLELWIFLIWSTVREVIQGNFFILPGFWQGILDGLKLLKQKEREYHGKYGL
jgi:GT2 family glycosyltransferase